jgi:hypothetical protein
MLLKKAKDIREAMIRTILDRQLQALSEQLLQLWNLNDQAFEQGLKASQEKKKLPIPLLERKEDISSQWRTYGNTSINSL